ncbi:protein trichome birefringence-like 14 [Aristolochia californica]|uniref:protein trichome birefringence-like 14 n=1 Tax=Aristolochia californica TaxID=171875 RepID=UPI0035E1F9EB
MKGGSLNGLRGKYFLFTIFALVCTSIFLWAWERTPIVTTFLAQEDQFEIVTPVSLKRNADIIEDSSDEDGERGTSNNQRIQGSNKAERDVNEEEDSSDAAGKGQTKSDQHSLDESGREVVLKAPNVSEARDPIEDQSIAPVGSTTITALEGQLKEGCNFAKGKWVPDDRRPLYSGFGCRQWLSEMWACRLSYRTDFFYERFRWQPFNCEMPEFERSAFLRRMQDKTIALVGDSLGRQQFQSLMCMVTGGKEDLEVQDVGKEYGLVKARGAIRPDGWVYRFPRTNTTILYYWSASLCELEPLNITNPNTEYAMHLDRPATFLRKYLHRFDVLVLNTGHHWNRGKLRGNRWVMYVDGKPNQNKAIAEIGRAKNLTIHSVVKWLDSQLPQHPKLKAFLRSISPRHFVNGDWNTGGSCDNTTPLAGGSEVVKEESADPIAEAAVRGTSVKLLDITAISQLRDECHISKYSAKSAEGVHDCLHWCLPGVPDTWNELLAAQV